MSFTANPKWQSARWWGCASAFKPKSRQTDGLFDVVVFVRQYLNGRVFRRTAGPLAAATTARRHLNGSVFRQTQSPVWRRGRCARAFRRNCFQTDRRLSQRHRRCCGGGTCARLIEIPGLSLSSTLPSVFLFIRLACVTGSVAMATGAR